MTNSATILRNSFWYGIDVGVTLVTGMAASIVLARVIGPKDLGYFNYVMWLGNVSGVIGSLGIPMATRKYMAEYLGKGQPGIARAIFFRALRMQAYLSLCTHCSRRGSGVHGS